MDSTLSLASFYKIYIYIVRIFAMFYIYNVKLLKVYETGLSSITPLQLDKPVTNDKVSPGA